MDKKGVQHQRRHRRKPSKWRYIWTVIVMLFRLLEWVSRLGE